jgi:hypothetical protein
LFSVISQYQEKSLELKPPGGMFIGVRTPIKQELDMISKRLRIYLAGLVAFLVGMPLTEKAFGAVDDIAWEGIDLGLAIASASEGS